MLARVQCCPCTRCGYLVPVWKWALPRQVQTWTPSGYTANNLFSHEVYSTLAENTRYSRCSRTYHSALRACSMAIKYPFCPSHHQPSFLSYPELLLASDRLLLAPISPSYIAFFQRNQASPNSTCVLHFHPCTLHSLCSAQWLVNT